MNIFVVGLGFVGLTSALGLAEVGHKVVGIEQDSDKLRSLKQHQIPFFEPVLEEKLANYEGSRFFLFETVAEAVTIFNPDIILICVGTPSQEDGKVDLSYVIAAIEQIGDVISTDNDCIICIKSTVPPSSARDQIQPIIDNFANLGLANNPEFLREGYAWQDFMQPDRIVIGSDNLKIFSKLVELYTPFNAPIHQVNLTEAEYIKYLSNTLLATLISFANEQSKIAHHIKEIDIQKTFNILLEDKRWKNQQAGSEESVDMASYVYPGCGFGGYCLPKDLQALIHQSEKFDYTPQLLKEVHQVNVGMIDYWVQQIVEKTIIDDRIAILGLAFKANSDDVRDTPAAKIIKGLLQYNRKKIISYDPQAMPAFAAYYDEPIVYCDTLQECIVDADAVVLCTAWNEFRKIQGNKHFMQIKENNKLFDLRYFMKLDAV